MKKLYIHREFLFYYRNYLKPIALYYKAKLTYHNSVVYNWNIHKISKRLNVSYYLTSKYVKWLLKEGMAFERNGNLVFVSMKKVTGLANDYPYKKGYEELKLDYDQPLLSVVDQLRYLLFKRKLKHQDYLIKLKHDNLKRSTQKKTSIKNFSPESVWHNTGIGMRKLSKHIGLSPSMTSKVTNDWVKNGLITKRPDREVIAKNVLVDEIELFREKIPGYLFVYNNTLFKYNYTNYSIL